MEHDQRRLAWVGVACAVAVGWAVHLPAIGSGFVTDDYVYLRAARDLSFGDYARAALAPHADEPLLFFTGDFYRPLYFLSFWPLERLFDGNPLPYHLLLLAAHSASIVMVFALARALALSPRGAVLAAFIFAASPLPHESVDWISSLNSVALPLGLGAVWAYLRGARAAAPGDRSRYVALSLVLFALALGFRETSLSFLGAIALLHAVPPPEWRLNREVRPYGALAPYLALAAAYYLLRTKLLTAPFSGEGQLDATPRESLQMLFDYTSMALLPLKGATEDWARAARIVSVVVLLGLLAWSVLARRRLPLVAALCGIGVTVPYCFSEFGAQGRYFYAPLAFYAIALAALAEWIVTMGFVARSAVLRRTAPVAVVAGLVVLSAKQWDNVNQWVEDFPEVSDAWVRQLRAHEAANGPGTAATLCAANAPLLLLLFDAYAVEATAQYHFPGIRTVVTYDPASPPPGCEDGFIYAPGG